MPELPEIETIRRAAGPLLVGRTVTGIDVLKAKSAGNDISAAEGRTVASVARRAKALIIALGDGSRLIMRFGMTGTLLVVPDRGPADRHARIVLHLDDGSRAEFRDMRMFGRIWHIPRGEQDEVSGIESAGMEPDDPRLDGAFLSERFGSRSIPVKSALLTQDTVCGLGNIYSDEVLWRARVRPLDRCRDLSSEDWDAIARAIPEAISEAVSGNSVSMEEYARDGGLRYRFNRFDAYGREGEPCSRCGAAMVRSVVGGRSSTWCPRCQSGRPHTTPYKPTAD